MKNKRSDEQNHRGVENWNLGIEATRDVGLDPKRRTRKVAHLVQCELSHGAPYPSIKHPAWFCHASYHTIDLSLAVTYNGLSRAPCTTHSPHESQTRRSRLITHANHRLPLHRPISIPASKSPAPSQMTTLHLSQNCSHVKPNQLSNCSIAPWTLPPARLSAATF